MLGKTNETRPQPRDSFFDDDEDEDDRHDQSTLPATPVISSIRIVTSKPPVYRQQSQNSSSPSPSSCYSDHDVTDVSSIAAEHDQLQQQEQQQVQQKKHEGHKRKSDQDRSHPFHLQSMKHVLLGTTLPTSRPPSPEHQQDDLNKKHVRILDEEADKNVQDSHRRHHHNHHNHRHHHRQPYIHGHTKDYGRIRLTSSAINRQRQQQRIERENLRILERLQHTRATHSLKRDELLSHYDRQMGYVTYPMAPLPHEVQLPSRPSSAAIPSTFSTSGRKATNGSRPSSASQAMNSNIRRSRPASATTSVHGSSRSSSARRPIWNDRWQQNE